MSVYTAGVIGIFFATVCNCSCMGIVAHVYFKVGDNIHGPFLTTEFPTYNDMFCTVAENHDGGQTSQVFMFYPVNVDTFLASFIQHQPTKMWVLVEGDEEETKLYLETEIPEMVTFTPAEDTPAQIIPVKWENNLKIQVSETNPELCPKILTDLFYDGVSQPDVLAVTIDQTNQFIFNPNLKYTAQRVNLTPATLFYAIPLKH